MLSVETARRAIKEYRQRPGWRSCGGANYAQSGHPLPTSSAEVIGASSVWCRLSEEASTGFTEALRRYHAKLARADKDQDCLMARRSSPIQLLRANFPYPHEIRKVTRGARYVVLTWFL